MYTKVNMDPWIESWLSFVRELGGFLYLSEADRLALFAEAYMELDTVDAVMHSSINGEMLVFEVC